MKNPTLHHFGSQNNLARFHNYSLLIYDPFYRSYQHKTLHNDLLGLVLGQSCNELENTHLAPGYLDETAAHKNLQLKTLFVKTR